MLSFLKRTYITGIILYSFSMRKFRSHKVHTEAVRAICFEDSEVNYSMFTESRGFGCLAQCGLWMLFLFFGGRCNVSFCFCHCPRHFLVSTKKKHALCHFLHFLFAQILLLSQSLTYNKQKLERGTDFYRSNINEKAA